MRLNWRVFNNLECSAITKGFPFSISQCFYLCIIEELFVHLEVRLRVFSIGFGTYSFAFCLLRNPDPMCKKQPANPSFKVSQQSKAMRHVSVARSSLSSTATE